MEPFAYTRDEADSLISRSRFLRTAVQELMPLTGPSEVWSRLREEVKGGKG